MTKICVFSGTRAEYGLLRPLMKQIDSDPDLHLQIIVSGTHLSSNFGLTYREIENDGFVIDEKIEVLLSADTATSMAKATGLGIISYSEALARLQPDFLVLLGDRFELLAMATASLYARIPIVHIHGGEATFSLIDEAIRHAVTKMSHLHFTSTSIYRQRVIQLGEQPERVFNVGALGVENILTQNLMTKKELEASLQFSLDQPFFLVTYHPVTLEKGSAAVHMNALLNALNYFDKYKVIFTLANADTGGMKINRMIKQYVANNSHRAIAFPNLGQTRYLSAMKYCAAVVGNSSSGIIEAPSFRIPTVNIGDRQKGRVKARSVIDCLTETDSITQALRKALDHDFCQQLQDMENPYEGKNTSAQMVQIMKKYIGKNLLIKEFYVPC